MEKLINDESLSEEFSKKQTMDEMYEFCSSIVGGYTEEEFDEFAYEMLKLSDEYSQEEALESKLEYVAGGKSSPKSKIAAIALSALTCATGTGIGAASVSAANNSRSSVTVSQGSSKPTSRWQKVKDFCKRNKKWLIGGAVAGGILAGIGITVGVIANKNSKPASQKPERQPQRPNLKEEISANKEKSKPAAAGLEAPKPKPTTSSAEVPKPETAAAETPKTATKGAVPQQPQQEKRAANEGRYFGRMGGLY